MTEEPVPLNYHSTKRRRKPSGAGTIVTGVVGAAAGFILFALVSVVTGHMTVESISPYGSGFRSPRPPMLRVAVAPYAYIAGNLLGRDHLIVGFTQVIQGLIYGAIIAVSIERGFAKKALAIMTLVHLLAIGAQWVSFH